MALYSSAYFHYTPTLENLKSIIENGIFIHFVLEEIYTKGGGVNHIAIPMACFCDTPLSYIKDIRYGCYGIGLSQMWGVEHGLQPVLYYPTNQECPSTQMVIEAEQCLRNDISNIGAYKILGYAKPMCGIDKHVVENGEKKPLLNYADKEWRKLYQSKGQRKWKTKEEYEIYIKQNKERGKSRPHIGSPLKFSASDVEFIIIHKRDEKAFREYIMRGEFKHIGGKEKVGINNEQREILLSKVVIYESLMGNM